MAGLNDLIRSSTQGASTQGGGIGKPLMIALGALLASNVLFGGKGQTASASAQPTTDTSDPGDVLGGLGGLMNKLKEGGLGDMVNSWTGSGQNQPVSPGQLGSALGPNVMKKVSEMTGISQEDLTKQLSQVLPGLVDKLTPNGRMPTAAEVSKMFERQ
jgi:uncharacterized protein YidB (DUF937 family)